MTLYREPHMHKTICTSLVGTHGIAHEVTWGFLGSNKVMEIPTYTTRLKLEAYKGREAHRWVQEKTCNKVRDGGS